MQGLGVFLPIFINRKGTRVGALASHGSKLKDLGE